MNIGLIGTGKMGKEIAALAPDLGHTIIFRSNRSSPLLSFQNAFDSIDVLIDFSQPDSIRTHCDLILERGIPWIIGTTGWNAEEEILKQKVKESGSAVLAAPNFSIGVALFHLILRQTAQLMHSFPAYDLSLSETHHTQKKDAPSGTALSLQAVLLEETNQMPIEIQSIREGDNPGKHTVTFSSCEDEISLTHQAHSRKGFALGALRAAEWIQGKTGYFTLNDFIKDILCTHSPDSGQRSSPPSIATLR